MALALTSARGTVDRTGTVTITFNLQSTQLPAPDVNGEPQHWLPCAMGCGEVESVSHRAISFVCNVCLGIEHERVR